jgi:hypothetical protein
MSVEVVEVKKAEGLGVGLFALCDLAAGTEVCEEDATQEESQVILKSNDLDMDCGAVNSLMAKDVKVAMEKKGNW